MTRTLALVLSPLFLQPSPSMVLSSAPGRLPRCRVLLLCAHCASREQGDLIHWMSKSTWWKSSLGGDLHQPFSILDYMPNKRRKGSPLLVIWLRKVGQQPRNMIDWNIRGRLPSIQTSVHGLLDMVKKKHFHHICVCTLYLFKE